MRRGCPTRRWRAAAATTATTTAATTTTTSTTTTHSPPTILHIPRQDITFKYESEQKPGQIPGDVVMKLKSIPHNTFKRNRDTLSMKLAIPLRAALLGFETAFKHLDGHSVHVKRSGVTKPGQVLRIKGEGMPKHGTPSEFGDLLITFTVDFPKSVEGALADGLESLLPPFSKTDIRIFQ